MSQRLSQVMANHNLHLRQANLQDRFQCLITPLLYWPPCLVTILQQNKAKHTTGWASHSDIIFKPLHAVLVVRQKVNSHVSLRRFVNSTISFGTVFLTGKMGITIQDRSQKRKAPQSSRQADSGCFSGYFSSFQPGHLPRQWLSKGKDKPGSFQFFL